MKLQKLLNGRSPEASPQASPKNAVECPPKLESESDDDSSSTEGVRVKTPTEHDVLFGRGKPYQGHPGNMRLHRFANAYKKRYSMARRHEKTEIAEEIVTLVKTEGGKQGRFLKRSADAGDEYWVEVSDSVARDKVSHALRGKSRKDELPTGLPVDTSKVLSALKKRTSKASTVSEPTSKKQRLSPSSVASSELLNSLEERHNPSSLYALTQETMKFAAACTVAFAASANAFAPATTGNRATQLSAMKDDIAKVGAAALASAAIFGITAAPAQAITKSELNQLSYLQVKGTGLANRCSEVVGEDTITPKAGARLVDMCIEPKAWAVEEEIGKAGKTEKKFVNSKVMTRQTYTLEGIEGSLKTDGGKIVFVEEEGIDYAPTTVQLPGGERVPFLFTVKELVATGNGGAFKPGFQMGGDFSVPSYRTGLFLDPKGRGGTTGYDMAVALPGLQSGEEGDAELFKENNKTFEVGSGRIEMEVNKVNAEESEIGGVFVASQSGDTDMGSKVPKKILTKGIFYAKVQ